MTKSTFGNLANENVKKYGLLKTDKAGQSDKPKKPTNIYKKLKKQS
jgi:hypothetical protein